MIAIKKAFQDGLPIYSVASSFTPVEVDLGSSQFEVIEKPKVMVVTGPGTSAYRVGEINTCSTVGLECDYYGR